MIDLARRVRVTFIGKRGIRKVGVGRFQTRSRVCRNVIVDEVTIGEDIIARVWYWYGCF